MRRWPGCINLALIFVDQRRRWESNPLETALQAAALPSGSSVKSFKCPRQESNLVFDLRRVACESGTLRGQYCQSVPRRGIEPRLAVSKTAVLSGTLAGRFSQSVSRPGLEPGPGPSEGPMRSATPSGQCIINARADDWIRTSIDRFTRPAPFSVEPRRQSSTSARSRTPSGGFGGRLLSQEHTRVMAPGRCDGRGRWRNDYSSSVDVPVRLADELRPAFDPHVVGARTAASTSAGPAACAAACPPARGVRSAFRLLQAMHASTQFSQVDMPPCDRGTTWSIVSSSLPGWAPQYWQV